MSRLSIEISAEEHQHIKTMAAVNGQSIKEFVMGRIFPEKENDHEVSEEFKAFLLNRIERAKSGRISSQSLHDITRSVLDEESKGA